MDTENRSRSVDLKDVRISGGFWEQKTELVRTQVLPYQWKAIHDEIPGAEPSCCIHNFEAAAQVIRDRKAGKSPCGGNCAACGACKGCSACGGCSAMNDKGAGISGSAR